MNNTKQQKLNENLFFKNKDAVFQRLSVKKSLMLNLEFEWLCSLMRFLHFKNRIRVYAFLAFWGAFKASAFCSILCVMCRHLWEQLSLWVKMPLFFTSKQEQDRWCHSFPWYFLIKESGLLFWGEQEHSENARGKHTIKALKKTLFALVSPSEMMLCKCLEEQKLCQDTSSGQRYYSCVRVWNLRTSCPVLSVRQMDRMHDDVFIRDANETWHISVDHHGVWTVFFLLIGMRKSCGSRFQSSGTACVTPTPPDRWRG